jgi:hypothetical protein
MVTVLCRPSSHVVAVQVDPFESKGLKPGNHISGSKGCETRRFHSVSSYENFMLFALADENPEHQRWVYGLWFMVYGLWFMVYGLWFMVYGLWFMVYGLWFMVYGLGDRV